MNKLAKRILTQMGANVQEYTTGDVVLSSPTFEKEVDAYDTHGPCTRERVQLVATRAAGGSKWLVEAFTERAEFVPTLGCNEVEVVTPVSKRHVGSYASSFGVAKAFRNNANMLAVMGFGDVRKHQMDTVRNDQPKAQILQLG